MLQDSDVSQANEILIRCCTVDITKHGGLNGYRLMKNQSKMLGREICPTGMGNESVQTN